MSLLTIAQGIARDAGFGVPSQIIGNSDQTAQMILAQINKAGQLIAQKSWQVLQKLYQFTTVNGTDNYPEPPDLGSYFGNTLWDRSNYWQLRGSLSPEEWQWYKSGTQTTMPRMRFRTMANKIYLDPVPTAAYNLVIEYVSNAWVTDGANFFTSFTTDTQTSVLDELMLQMEANWRFLARKGLSYEEDKAQAESNTESNFSRDLVKNSINFGNRLYEIWPPLPTVPVTGYS